MTSIFGESFNRSDIFPRGSGNKNLARADRVSFQNYGASTALADSASIFRAGQVEMIAQSPQQRSCGVDLEFHRFTVHCEVRFFHSLAPIFGEGLALSV
jgi:hypothetical protein